MVVLYIFCCCVIRGIAANLTLHMTLIDYLFSVCRVHVCKDPMFAPENTAIKQTQPDDMSS